MPFVPKDWRDDPDTSTPITAAALEDLEARLSGYTDTQAGTAPVTGDGVYLADAAMTSGQATLTSASAPFTAADVGKIVSVLGAGGGTPAAGKGFTITAYVSPTQVTLNTTASATVSNATAFYGTDNAAAFAAAFAALPNGGVVQLKPRIYMTSNEVVIPGGACLRGTGYSYPADGTAIPNRGAMVVAGGTFASTRLMKVGDMQATLPITDPSFTSAHTAPKLDGVVVYASNLTNYACYIAGARHRVERCEFRAATTAAINNTGQNGHVIDCVIAMHRRATGITNTGDDNKYRGNQVRGWVTNGINILGGQTEMSENHVFNENADDATAGAMVKIGGSGVMMRGNVLGGTNLRQPDILIVGAGTNVKSILIDGNYLYRLGPTSGSAAVPSIQIDTTAAGVDHLTISNNQIRGDTASEANTGYKSMVDVTGTNAVTGWALNGNNGMAVAAFVTAAGGQAPSSYHGNLRSFDAGAGRVQSVYSQGMVPANVQTGSYTLTLDDSGRAVELNSASATVLTVPPNASVAFPVGTVIEVARLGAGTVTIAAGAGVTIHSAGGLLAIGNQYGSVSLRQRAADEWVLVGDLA